MSRPDTISSFEVTQFVYDPENRLIELSSTNLTANYKYDSLGRRIEKNVNGDITRYIYDDANIILEFNEYNTIKTNYTNGLDLDQFLAIELNNEEYYLLKDGLGSVTEITDQLGNVVQSYVYNSFGRIVDFNQSLENNITYTGRELDSESGLYYYRNRYYDSSIGRFISEDPLGLTGGDINLYVYTKNNPINFRDPLGLTLWICNRKTTGVSAIAFFGLANHSYFYDDEDGSCCGMGETKACNEKGPDGDDCKPIPGGGDDLMDCCNETAYDTKNVHNWFPWKMDCHTILESCFIENGYQPIEAPGGRLGDTCGNCSEKKQSPGANK